jgi:hypothetical protein
LDQWEAAKRCPEYLKLCEGVEFSESGLVSMKWVAQNRERHDEINKCLNRAGIKQLIDPQKNPFEIQPEIIFDIFSTPSAVIVAPGKLPKSFDDNESYERRFLEDGRYLIVKMDMLQKKEDIRHQINLYLDRFHDRADTRTRLKPEDWKAYDMSKEGKKDKEIIELIWPEEYKKATENDPYKLNKEWEEKREELKKKGRKITEQVEKELWDDVYKKGAPKFQNLYTNVNAGKKRVKEKIKEMSLRFKPAFDSHRFTKTDIHNNNRM